MVPHNVVPYKKACRFLINKGYYQRVYIVFLVKTTVFGLHMGDGAVVLDQSFKLPVCGPPVQNKYKVGMAYLIKSAAGGLVVQSALDSDGFPI